MRPNDLNKCRENIFKCRAVLVSGRLVEAENLDRPLPESQSKGSYNGILSLVQQLSSPTAL